MVQSVRVSAPLPTFGLECMKHVVRLNSIAYPHTDRSWLLPRACIICVCDEVEFCTTVLHNLHLRIKL